VALMNPELENLEELLDVLRRERVRRYQNGGLVIELDLLPPEPEVPPTPVTRQADRVAAAERREANAPETTAYQNPALWGGGQPPKFPGSR
jgi:hypothetical protein